MTMDTTIRYQLCSWSTCWSSIWQKQGHRSTRLGSWNHCWLGAQRARLVTVGIALNELMKYDPLTHMSIGRPRLIRSCQRWLRPTDMMVDNTACLCWLTTLHLTRDRETEGDGVVSSDGLTPAISSVSSPQVISLLPPSNKPTMDGLFLDPSHGKAFTSKIQSLIGTSVVSQSPDDANI